MATKKKLLINFHYNFKSILKLYLYLFDCVQKFRFWDPCPSSLKVDKQASYIITTFSQRPTGNSFCFPQEERLTMCEYPVCRQRDSFFLFLLRMASSVRFARPPPLVVPPSTQFHGQLAGPVLLFGPLLLLLLISIITIALTRRQDAARRKRTGKDTRSTCHSSYEYCIVHTNTNETDSG